MRFKGFFKEYWTEVFKPSISWMKKFWLPYSILLVVTFIVSFCYTWYRFFGLDVLKSSFSTRTDGTIDEF